MQVREFKILKLEEEREKVKVIHAHHQQILKDSFDSSFVTPKKFQIGYLVLKWDKAHREKGKHTKFQRLWLGPFQIIEEIGPSTFLLQDLLGKTNSFSVNGQILKKYFSSEVTSSIIVYYCLFLFS